MNLGSRAVAYLNVDCAVQGPGLFPSMTPQLDDLLIDVTKKVRGLHKYANEFLKQMIILNIWFWDHVG